ncbi:hypothetical protein KCP76_08605 [Salmonella enterica subsp. enterica serovar Weltevreden]|nr:hypothetical protein KCP76_08605 [Salmonella enterica subsp. enterica serovar Weltevreden]
MMIAIALWWDTQAPPPTQKAQRCVNNARWIWKHWREKLRRRSVYNTGAQKIAVTGFQAVSGL